MSELNPVLGYWTCELGGKAVVKQTRKRGKHFYTQCDCCGLNQGTGQARQKRIWLESDFLPDIEITPPAFLVGVERSEAVPERAEPEPEAKTEAETKAEPAEVDDFVPEGVSETEDSGGTGRTGPLIAGAVLLLAAGAGLWMG